MPCDSHRSEVLSHRLVAVWVVFEVGIEREGHRNLSLLRLQLVAS